MNKTSKMKRTRRGAIEMDQLLQGVLNILGEYNDRITVRHLFYRCSGERLIEKTEDGYNQLRGHLVKWRRTGAVPMDAFVDGTRWHYGTDGHDSVEEFLHDSARSYRRNLWQNQPWLVETWVEKDAVASIIAPLSALWTLRTFVTRGDASLSSLAAAAQTFNEARQQGRQPVVLYLGDHDETGLAIPKTIQRNLLRDHHCEVELRRVAVNLAQIEEWNLPTRPPKGSRRGESITMACELDVLTPAQIKSLLTAEIESLVDTRELDTLRMIEAAERESLEKLRLPRR